MGIAPAFDGTKYGNFLYIRSGCIDRRDFAALVWRCFLYPVPDFPIFPERAPVCAKAVFVPCGKMPVRAKAVLASGGKAAGETKQPGVLLLSSACILAVVFCYGESLAPVYIDRIWSATCSYVITSRMHQNLITDEYIDSVRSLPGIEETVAWNQKGGTLEFEGMEENPFSSLLAEHIYGIHPWDMEVNEYGEYVTTGPEGLWCYVYGVAEENQDKFFRYVKEDIDREKFRDGETVLLYIPYNKETGVELGGRLYGDFGVSVGDVVKVVVLEVDEKKKRIALSMKQAK